jgi:hypothetical protein
VAIGCALPLRRDRARDLLPVGRSDQRDEPFDKLDFGEKRAPIITGDHLSFGVGDTQNAILLDASSSVMQPPKHPLRTNATRRRARAHAKNSRPSARTASRAGSSG